MKIYKIASTCIFGLATLAMTSCSDNDNIIESLVFNKNFAPLGIEANSVKETTASITWKTAANATNYNLEVFADDSLTFAGTPEQVITGLTADDIPYTISNLQFDTKYSVRIQSLTEGDEGRTSTWNGVYFRTGTKQFLKNPKPAEIADRSVTLSWEVEEGYDVSQIVIGDITHNITAEEKEAGQAVIEGLTPETEYTAYLYYNGKQCGNRKFITIADLEGAILVHEGDDLKAIIEDEELPANAIIAVYGGTYELNYNEESGGFGAVKINKSMTIKGIYPTDQPIFKGRFELNDGAGLTLSQVVIDGIGNSTADQIFNYKTANVNYGALDIQNCTITGRSDGKGLLYLNVKATVESITFNNCIVSGIECSGGDFIDSRTGHPKALTLTNSTFYNVASTRQFIRIDDPKVDGFSGTNVKVDHCTLYNVGGSANASIYYVRFPENKFTFTNNIVVGTVYKRGFTNQSTSDQEPTLENNFYFDCQNLTSPGTGADANICWFDTDTSAYDITTDTGTKARGKGNGTVLETSPFSGEAPSFAVDPNSKAFTAGAGDPRWLQ